VAVVVLGRLFRHTLILSSTISVSVGLLFPRAPAQLRLQSRTMLCWHSPSQCVQAAGTFVGVYLLAEHSLKLPHIWKIVHLSFSAESGARLIPLLLCVQVSPAQICQAQAGEAGAERYILLLFLRSRTRVSFSLFSGQPVPARGSGAGAERSILETPTLSPSPNLTSLLPIFRSASTCSRASSGGRTLWEKAERYFLKLDSSSLSVPESEFPSPLVQVSQYLREGLERVQSTTSSN
jgi:hypothetical protein